MAFSKSVGPDTNPGLFVTLRTFSSVLLSIATTRLDLATLELEEQAARVLRVVISGLAAVICVASTIFFLMLFIVVLLWDHKVILMGAITVIYLIASIVFVTMTRKLITSWPKFLGQTLLELKNDADNLKQVIKPVVEKKP